MERRNRWVRAVISGGALMAAVACGAADSDEGLEEPGVQGQGIPKGNPGAQNGDVDYCDNPAELCVSGEGDCDAHTQCVAPLICGRDNGPKFGMPSGYDVCVPSHCNNKKKDGDETSIDCGGSCGFNCSVVCTSPPLPPNGQSGHCTTDCPCPAGHGYCVNDGDCQTGLVCRANSGALFGFAPGVNMCMGAHCFNGAQDGDETGVDCGGSCGPCIGITTRASVHGGTAGDRGMSVAVDVNGNTYIVGVFSGSASYGGPTVTSNGAADYFVVKFNGSGGHVWTRSLGGTNDEGTYISDIAVDGSGNVVILGSFLGSADFGGGTLTSNGGHDVLLVKLDTNGNHLWSKLMGGSGIDRGNGVIIDSSGNIVIVGAFDSTIDLGGGTLTSAGNYDAFVARYSSSGTHLASARFGSTGRDEAWDVALTSTALPWVVGSFSGTVSFGSINLTSSAGQDGFAIRTTTALSPTIAVGFGGSASQIATSVAVDTSNRPFVGGISNASFTIPTGTVGNNGSWDVFGIALTSSGGFRWHRSYGGTGVDQGTRVAANATGVSISAFFESSIDLGAGGIPSAGGRDLFRVVLNHSGTLLSGRAFGTSGTDRLGDVVARHGVLYTTGTLNGTLDFGTGSLTTSGEDMFLEISRF